MRPVPRYSQCNPDNKLVPIPETYLSYAPPHCIAQPQGPLCPGPVDSDDSLLAIFRAELMPVYPFVVIPGDMSAETLKAQKPFLMSAVRMVSSLRSLQSMRGQMFQIMGYLADHMLLRAERSVDLLMGLVVVLGWYHYHCLRHSQMNNLLGLAEGLVADLGLGREERESSVVEKRLVLGVWYLRSW